MPAVRPGVLHRWRRDRDVSRQPFVSGTLHVPVGPDPDVLLVPERRNVEGLDLELRRVDVSVNHAVMKPEGTRECRERWRWSVWTDRLDALPTNLHTPPERPTANDDFDEADGILAHDHANALPVEVRDRRHRSLGA